MDDLSILSILYYQKNANHVMNEHNCIACEIAKMLLDVDDGKLD